MTISNAINNHRLIAFTTPETYATRLSPLIHRKGWTPIWCPTVTVETTSHTKTSLLKYLSPPTPCINEFSALAFTSRTGISAFSDALSCVKPQPLCFTSSSTCFTICALGKDSELIDDKFIDQLCSGNRSRVKILVPQVSTPSGLVESLVESLGVGRGRKVLCPVPLVVGLEEPVVVPNFLRELEMNGWVAVRVDAYETRWMGEECAKVLLRDKVDAVVFTSTGEVEGMLKSLRAMGLEWGDVVERNPGIVVAAHGPVTAAGAESLGVSVNVVSTRFSSFDGIVDALAQFWNG